MLLLQQGYSPECPYATYYNVSLILFAFDIWTQSYAEFLNREFSYGIYTLFAHAFSQGRATASYGVLSHLPYNILDRFSSYYQ
jgi:hypothetical protein